jgi:transcriptional regulator with XRE-family HTH domain
LLVIVILVWRKEQHWMREELADEIGVGTLTPEEYGAVNTSSGRQRLLAKTLRRDGWTAYRRLNRLYTLFTELAFKKHQLRSMGSEPGTVREIERLRLAIQKERGDSSGQPV